MKSNLSAIKYQLAAVREVPNFESMKTRLLLLLWIVVGITTTLFIACNQDDMGACFTASSNNVSPLEVVTFTNCSSLQTVDQACYWSFGDGVDTTIYGNSAVQHSYTQTGKYQVKLKTGTGAKESTHTLDLSIF